MKEDVKKAEVEGLLGCALTDGQFREALEYAKTKQECIYAKEKRPEVLERWYLLELAVECARTLALARLTMDLCGTAREAEKGRPARSQGANRVPLL